MAVPQPPMDFRVERVFHMVDRSVAHEDLKSGGMRVAKNIISDQARTVKCGRTMTGIRSPGVVIVESQVHDFVI